VTPSPNSLQQLIAARRDEDPERYSYSSIARRGGLPRSTVHALATRLHETKTPRPATIEKLAVGLELPGDRVRAAAAAAAGYAVESVSVQLDSGVREQIDVIVVGLEKLAERDVRRVQRIVQGLIDEADEDAETAADAADRPSRRRRR
jgi:hypothetical protein